MEKGKFFYGVCKFFNLGSPISSENEKILFYGSPTC